MTATADIEPAVTVIETKIEVEIEAMEVIISKVASGNSIDLKPNNLPRGTSSLGPTPFTSTMTMKGSKDQHMR